MKIAVICANGKKGKLIARKAIARGAAVTTVIRGETNPQQQMLSKKTFLN